MQHLRLDDECTRITSFPGRPLHLSGWLVWVVTVVCRMNGSLAELEGPVVPETGEDRDLQRGEREQQDGVATALTGSQTGEIKIVPT